MLTFRSEGDVDTWCERRSIEKGAVLTLQQMWDLCKVWYPGRGEASWRGRSVEEAQALFLSVGLTGSFWTF